jgi:diguanylate cyclase (GGDEF)-like protein
MLQAEILVQYGMRNKALERLQRIQQLFPHEEERNPDLHQLYMSAGMLPQYAPGTGPAAATAPSSVPEVQPAVPDMTGFAKIPEITRKLNQQSTAQAVLSTAAHEIGTQWNLDRCVVALRKPGLAISSLKEFHAENARPAKSDVFEDMICRLHDIAVTRGAMVFPDVSAAEELKEFSQQLTPLGVRSLLVVPLGEGQESLGVLLLISSVQRKWTQNDALVFKTIAEQAAIALSNAGLRRLVKNLSVTDENSGLLNRASYLDLLMGEIKRARQQNSPTSVLLMRFTERPTPGKEQGEVGAEAMQRMGQVVAANIRQNDLAFRYTGNTIAIVLGETSEKEALLAVEKMRRVISAAAAKQSAAAFNAGVAEAVLRQEFDPVDIVTEVINRAERALENSLAEGMGTSAALAAKLASAAVA